MDDGADLHVKQDMTLDLLCPVQAGVAVGHVVGVLGDHSQDGNDCDGEDELRHPASTCKTARVNLHQEVAVGGQL